MLSYLYQFPLIAQADPGNIAESVAKNVDIDFSKIFTALMIVAVAIVTTRVIQATLDRLGEGQAKRRLMLKKVASFSRVAIFGFATYMLIMTFFDAEEDKTALIGLGGTLAVTIGFALKDTASSVMAGILILFDQPFQVGDRVTFGDTYGEVTEIGLRSVRIVTLDDSEVSIPNNKFLTEAVTSGNSGALDMMIVIKFYIAMEEDFDLARRIIYEACVTSKYVYLNKPVAITMTDQVAGMAFATVISCKAYVIDTRYETAFVTDVTARVKRAFKENGIKYPSVGVSEVAVSA
jgi:small-conductance mechanosensitive channel